MIVSYIFPKLSKIANENEFIEAHDDSLECSRDELRASTKVSPMLYLLLFSVAGGLFGPGTRGYHGCEYFSERWFNYQVFVVRSNHTILYDRLEKRD